MAQHLTEEQLDFLRRQLLDQQARLKEIIHEELLSKDEQRYQDLAGQVHDAGEESVADLLSEMGLEFLERHKLELIEVEEALERMKQGRYGRCQDTGDPIDYERLKAYPTARRSAERQRRYEQSHANNTGHTL